MEIQKYREKLVDMEFYKAREGELREDNRVLLETREMLEEQLQQARRRADKGMDLQHEIMKMKQRENDVALVSILFNQQTNYGTSPCNRSKVVHLINLLIK